jgi:hypothetical protein
MFVCSPRQFTGPTYLWEFFNSYLSELVSSPKSLTSTLRLFQELDSHSVFHLLPSISQPVLIISGALDGVTPAMQSVQIARRIQHSTHYCVCVCLTVFDKTLVVLQEVRLAQCNSQKDTLTTSTSLLHDDVVVAPRGNRCAALGRVCIAMS